MENYEDLAREIAALSAHLDAATHRLPQCIRSFDESGGWHEQAARDVSAETLRRVACDCGLLPVGRDGRALNIGRRARITSLR